MDGHSRRTVLGPARIAPHAQGATVGDPEDEPLEQWAEPRDKRLRPVGEREGVHLGNGAQRAAHLLPDAPRLIVEWDGHQWVPLTAVDDYAAAQRMLHGIEGDGLHPARSRRSGAADTGSPDRSLMNSAPPVTRRGAVLYGARADFFGLRCRSRRPQPTPGRAVSLVLSRPQSGPQCERCFAGALV
ncbi:DUF6087 family protein [Streptomyces sp. NPDC015171]|uniref:DUF6087 family protein n=1 Tax=Streptomyces sp. NPDC015171 TaxID=3364945 RepID=UPI0037001150